VATICSGSGSGSKTANLRDCRLAEFATDIGQFLNDKTNAMVLPKKQFGHTMALTLREVTAIA